MKKRSLLFVITAIVIVVGTVFIVRNLNKSEDAINNEMLIENNVNIISIAVHQNNLEDVFLSLTGKKLRD